MNTTVEVPNATYRTKVVIGLTPQWVKKLDCQAGLVNYLEENKAFLICFDCTSIMPEVSDWNFLLEYPSYYVATGAMWIGDRQDKLGFIGSYIEAIGYEVILMEGGYT